MSQPHYIDREAVAALIEKLRAVESSRVHGGFSAERATTNWHRNPDGPEAADMIERLAAPMEADTSLQKMQRTPPAMEAVAWLSEWQGAGGPARALHDTEQEAIDNAKWMSGRAQALAVIPTQGGEAPALYKREGG